MWLIRGGKKKVERGEWAEGQGQEAYLGDGGITAKWISDR